MEQPPQPSQPSPDPFSYSNEQNPASPYSPHTEPEVNPGSWSMPPTIPYGPASSAGGYTQPQLPPDFAPGNEPLQGPLRGLPASRRPWIIGGAALLVVLLAALCVFVLLPKSPPSDWIANYSSAGLFSSGQAVFYIHWDNQNGNLTGQMQITAASGGMTQTLTVPFTGTYNSQDHSVFLTLTVNGTSEDLSGTINQTDNTMTLTQVNSNQQGDQLVFRAGSESDYQQEVQNLEKGGQ